MEARRDLWVSYNKLGDVCRARGDLAGAAAYYEKGLALREALAAETGTVEAYNELAISYAELALCKNPPDRGMLERALAISQSLAEQCPDVERYARSRDMLRRMLS